jgi:hypothetical protein
MAIEYFMIPSEILRDKPRSVDELLILSLAISFRENGLRMSNAEIARVLNSHEKSVSRDIGRLLKKGRIRVSYKSGQRVIVTELLRSPDPDPVTPLLQGSNTSVTSGVTHLLPEGNIPVTPGVTPLLPDSNTGVTHNFNNYMELQKHTHRTGRPAGHDTSPLSRQRPKVQKPARFAQPTWDQWQEYCRHVEFDDEDEVSSSFNYYATRGWCWDGKKGPQPVADWKAAARGCRDRWLRTKRGRMPA